VRPSYSRAKPIQFRGATAGWRRSFPRCPARNSSKLVELRTRLESLTPRELEVLRQAIAGKPNKQIAADLGTGEQTLKVHRMRITARMGMAAAAELVRAAERLGIKPASSVRPGAR